MKKILKLFLICLYVLFNILLLYVIFFKSGSNYIFKREEVNISKILVLAIDFILIFLSVVLIKKKDLSNKKYFIIITILQIILFIIQITILLNIKFNTGWDVQFIRDATNEFLKNGSIENNKYLTMYPNNLLLVGILVLIAKLPLIGKYYLTTLIINSLLVNISTLFISLSIKNFHSNKLGLLIYLFIIPVIILNPWFIIPYSDTFALFFISLITYIYSKSTKNYIDYFIIIFMSIFGVFIKPMIIIPLISIILCELINFKNINFKEYKKYLTVGLSILLALFISNYITYSLNFTKVKDKYSMSIYHYLSMGQNTSTFGFYNSMDEINSYNKGPEFDKKTFLFRFKSNIGKRHLELMTNKVLITFGDGSFYWGGYGSFFPNSINNSKTKNIFQNIYYSNGKYYAYYLNICNYIWFCLLLLLPFILIKKVSKSDLYLILCFIGIYSFILLFEPCSRYIYSFSGIFLMISIIGLSKIYSLLK